MTAAVEPGLTKKYKYFVTKLLHSCAVLPVLNRGDYT